MRLSTRCRAAQDDALTLHRGGDDEGGTSACAVSERATCNEQGCAAVALQSLMCSPDAIAVTTRVAKECQLSRAVVAKLLSRIDTKAKAPFSEPLLPSVGSRLNQLTARKRATRLKPDDGEGKEARDAGSEAAGAFGKRKGGSVDVKKLKRQRKPRSKGGAGGDEEGVVAGGKRRKRSRIPAGNGAWRTARPCACL